MQLLTFRSHPGRVVLFAFLVKRELVVSHVDSCCEVFINLQCKKCLISLAAYTTVYTLLQHIGTLGAISQLVIVYVQSGPPTPTLQPPSTSPQKCKFSDHLPMLPNFLYLKPSAGATLKIWRQLPYREL